MDVPSDVFFLLFSILAYSSLNSKEPLTIGLELLQACTYTYVMNYGKAILCCFFHTSIMQTICVAKDLGHSQELWMHYKYPLYPLV